MLKQALLIVLSLGCAVSSAQTQSPGEGSPATLAGRREGTLQKPGRRVKKHSITAPTPSGGPAMAAAMPGDSPRRPCAPEAGRRDPDLLGVYLAPRMGVS